MTDISDTLYLGHKVLVFLALDFFFFFYVYIIKVNAQYYIICSSGTGVYPSWASVEAGGDALEEDGLEDEANEEEEDEEEEGESEDEDDDEDEEEDVEACDV